MALPVCTLDGGVLLEKNGTALWFYVERLYALDLEALKSSIASLIDWSSSTTDNYRVQSQYGTDRLIRAGESFLGFIPMTSLAFRAYENSEIDKVIWLWETFGATHVWLGDFILNEGLQRNCDKVIRTALDDKSYVIKDHFIIYHAIRRDHTTHDVIHALLEKLNPTENYHYDVLAAEAWSVGRIDIIDLLMTRTTIARVLPRLNGLLHVHLLQHLIIKYEVTLDALGANDIAARTLKTHGTKGINVVMMLARLGCDICAARDAHPFDATDMQLSARSSTRWLRRRGWSQPVFDPYNYSESDSDDG